MASNNDPKAEDQKPPLDPNKPDPSVKPPTFIVSTEGWDPDPSIFKVREGKAEKDED